uniref:(northern house mosquito) hypothetical protein n=1 Tax=Culex pipiens TaxID=7175 RepID=A0A8D8C853_CULPI
MINGVSILSFQTPRLLCRRRFNGCRLRRDNLGFCGSLDLGLRHVVLHGSGGDVVRLGCFFLRLGATDVVRLLLLRDGFRFCRLGRCFLRSRFRGFLFCGFGCGRFFSGHFGSRLFRRRRRRFFRFVFGLFFCGFGGGFLGSRFFRLVDVHLFRGRFLRLLDFRFGFFLGGAVHKPIHSVALFLVLLLVVMHFVVLVVGLRFLVLFGLLCSLFGVRSVVLLLLFNYLILAGPATLLRSFGLHFRGLFVLVVLVVPLPSATPRRSGRRTALLGRRCGRCRWRRNATCAGTGAPATALLRRVDAHVLQQLFAFLLECILALRRRTLGRRFGFDFRRSVFFDFFQLLSDRWCRFHLRRYDGSFRGYRGVIRVRHGPRDCSSE